MEAYSTRKKTDADPGIWFKSLFDTHYNGLCNYAFAFVKDDGAAEDIVQSAFMVIWEKRESLMQSEKIKQFLVRTVKNKCIDHFRKNRRFVSLSAEHSGILSETPEMEEEDNSDLKKLLTYAISQLPEKTRQTFLLSRKEGLTYKEIAGEMGISVKTVENQISRALRHLRDFFREHSGLIRE